tara:strand:- start:216 stop:431 length:216 start_codon:yes stop_codon:yes gene_type:complete
MVKTSEENVTIDGKEYSLEDLSDKAKANIVNVQFVDAQIQQLNNEWAVADTARIGYTTALKKEMSKNSNGD